MSGIHNTAMKIRFSQPIFGAEMSPRVATRHAEAYATSEAFGIQTYFRGQLIFEVKPFNERRSDDGPFFSPEHTSATGCWETREIKSSTIGAGMLSTVGYWVGAFVVLVVSLYLVAGFTGARKYLEERGFHFWSRIFGLPGESKTGPDELPNAEKDRAQSLVEPSRHSTVPQLPDPVADFVGREDQVAQITACLERQQGAAISAIGGQGGVGKTELAYYVAREVRDHYPDGQVQINLRGLAAKPAKPATPAEAMRDVLLRLAPDQQLPDNDQHLAELYQGLLAERRVLILADNAKDSAQVVLLVPKPPSALLVTSRQSIPLPGVEAVNLDELAPDEAAKLLRENVAEDRVSNDEIARLAELCGYLPLALRAAGERLAGARTLSTAAYIEKLERDRGDLRYQGKEVMAVLAGSVEALVHDQAELVEKWRSLAVFPAPFGRDTAKAVGELDDEELEVLVSRNLVLFDEKEERFRLHDLFRDLAREGLAEEKEYAAAKRHAGHFLHVAAAADDRYDEGNEGVHDGLGSFDRERTHIEAGQAWAAAHAEDDDEAAAFAQGYPLRAPSMLSLRLHARNRIAWLETSTQAARKLGNKKQEGLALGNLGNAYGDLGEPRKAIEYNEQVLAIARETGDRRGEGRTLGNLGNAFRDIGETSKAIEHYEQHLAIARETGDRRGEGYALGNLGLAYSALGETRKAIEYFEQDLAIARETGDRRGEGMTLGNLGLAYSDLGEPRKAIEHYEQHLPIAREIGDRRGEGMALHNRALTLDKLGRRDEAIADAQAALAICEEMEDPTIDQTRQLLKRWGALPDP